MPKIIAGVLILIASFILSGSISNYYNKRIKFLNEYLEFLTFAEGEIEFYKREMKTLISRFVDGKSGEFSAFMKERFIDGKKISADDDKKQVEEFILGMEELDSESQKGFAKICGDRASKTLIEAEKNVKIKSSLIKRLLPLGGVAVFLIII